MLHDWKIGAKLTAQFALSVGAGMLLAWFIALVLLNLTEFFVDGYVESFLLRLTLLLSVITVPIFVRDIRRQVIVDWEFIEKLGPNPKM